MPDLPGALGGAACGLAAAPYLARLTRRAPDRDDARWWRWGPPVHRRDTGHAAVTAAVLGALAGAAAGVGAAWPASVALALCTATLTIIDIRTHRLPDRLVVPAALAVVALAVTEPGEALRAAAGATLVLVALALLAAPGWLGVGDVKLGAVLGSYLARFGWPAVV